MTKSALTLIGVMATVLLLILGFMAGSWLQQRYDWETAYLERNNLTERACVDDMGRLNYCRLLNVEECRKMIAYDDLEQLEHPGNQSALGWKWDSYR